MSFVVSFYTINKRDNSTKRPATGTGTQYNCVLKDRSSILHPEIQLDLGLVTDPSHYNFAHIGQYNRYYFVEEWTFEKGLWTASLKVDVLATYKPEIGNSTLYVLRAAAEKNGAIVDTLYPAMTSCNYDADVITNPWTTFCCVIGCVSKEANVGSQIYYVMTPNELATVCRNLQDKILDDVTNSANGFSLQDAAPALQLSLVNPLQYIKSCILLPVPVVDVPTFGSGNTAIIYNWDTGVTGRKVTAEGIIEKDYIFNVIKHPSTTDRGNYVNCKPFTNISLCIPPFGVIDVDTSVTCNADRIHVVITIDPHTGKGTMSVRCHGLVLNRIESQIGVPISLSSVTRDYIGAVNGAAGAVGGAIGGYASGGAAGAVLGSVSGIGNAIQSLVPRANTVGTSGGIGSLVGDFRLDHQFFRVVDDDPTHNGRPLCKMKQISDLSGYILVQDGDVIIDGTSQEDSEIRSYLEGGFYYE